MNDELSDGRVPHEQRRRPAAPPTPRPEPEEVPADGEGPSVLASTGSMAIATLISRITGFFKILLTAAVLGPAMSSAFISANTLPRTISEFVLGAVLTAVVIPVLVRAEREDADGGKAFVRKLFTVATAVFGVATVVSIAGAPWLSELLVGKDSEVDLGLTTALAYLLLPTVLFYGLTALLTAVLNTRSVFKPGAWAPVVNNVVAITTLILYYLVPGEITLDPVSMGSAKLLVLGLGTTLGVVVQVAVLVPSIRRQGISLRPMWGIDPRLKTFGAMALAIIIYVGISQAGLVVTTRIAAAADGAGPAIYNFVWLLLQVPYGILGVTLLTAIMPQLSRNAAAGDNRAVVGDLTMSTKLTMLALLPVVMFFTFDGPAIGRALFHYGAFGGESATTLGITLSASAFTLIPYAMVLLHLRVFYAREQAWTPNFIIIGIMVVKTVLSLLAPVFFPPEHVVIALGAANGIGFVAGSLIGAHLLRRDLGPLGMRSVLWDSARVLAASAAGVAAMLLVELITGLHDLASGSSRGLLSLLAALVDGVVMLTVTVVVLLFMGIPMVNQVAGSLARVAVRLLPAAVVPGWLRRAAESDAAADGDGDDDVDSGGPGGGEYRPPRPDAGAPDHAPQAQPGPDDPHGIERPGGDPRLRPPRDPLFSGPAQPFPDLLVPYSGFDTATYDPVLPRVDAALRKLTVTETHAAAQRAGSARPSQGPRLIPGAMVAGGRYRLLVRHGGIDGLQFWKSLDTRLDRDVALTFIDAEGARSGDRTVDAHGILTRTLRLGKITAPGLARVLDVVRGASGGIVVSEWTEGSPLHEVAASSPPADGAARAVAVLAAAAEEAHRAGTELSIDHPDRIRITPSGAAVLAFPATLPGATQADDVHGLGATLYALLTNEWPATDENPEAQIGGLHTALLGAQGLPTEPHLVRDEVPFEISALAMRAIAGGSGIRTAATVQHVLEQAAEAPAPQRRASGPRRLITRDRAPREDGPGDHGGSPAGEAHDREAARPASPSSRRRDDDASYALLMEGESKGPSRRTMGMILVGLGIAVLAVVIVVLLSVGNVFVGGSDAPLTQQKIGLNPTTSTAPPSEEEQAPPPPPASVPARPASVAVYSPQGTPDDPRGATLAIDGDPGTQWSSDQYFQQLPALKPGLGLMASFDHPVKVMTVGIDSPTPDTHVEIRTAPGPNASIGQTTLIASADLTGRHTEIPIDPPAETGSQYLLVWITKLAPSGSGFQSKITELTFTVAE